MAPLRRSGDTTHPCRRFVFRGVLVFCFGILLLKMTSLSIALLTLLVLAVLFVVLALGAMVVVMCRQRSSQSRRGRSDVVRNEVMMWKE